MKIEIDVARVITTFFKVYVTALFLVPTGIILFRNFRRMSDATQYSLAEEIIPKFKSESKDSLIGRPKDDVEPEIAARDAVWQSVEHRKLFVYSAFYDDRSEWSKIVQVIGAAKAFRNTPVQCKFWYASKKLSTTRANVQCREHSNTSYTMCFVQCPFVSEETPYSVSISTEYQSQHRHSKPMNRLLVVSKNHKNVSKTVAVCVTPLRQVYNDSIQLVEFMELNKILGLSHVTFYKTSISITTDCILRSYVDEGRATVLLWNDHFQSQSMTTTDTASLNDCMYRNHNFNHLAFLGPNEFIMPAEADTIQEMIDNLDQKRLRTGYEIGSYNFRNGLFYVDRPNDPDASTDAFERSLTTLLKTRRREDLYPNGIRSRYIVKPTKVLELGNHLVRKFVNGYNRLTVSESEGIINSYNKCNLDTGFCDIHSTRKDTTASRYKTRLVAAVKTRWRHLQEKCGVEDIQEKLLDTILNPPS